MLVELIRKREKLKRETVTMWGKGVGRAGGKGGEACLEKAKAAGDRWRLSTSWWDSRGKYGTFTG